MFAVVENLRAFFNSRPPLVVFMICLASFAIALITFAYIVKTKGIPDSDVTEDWNHFLEKFSKIDLCFSQNSSDDALLNSTGLKLATGDLSLSEIYQVVQERLKQINIYESVKLHRIVSREVQSSSIVPKTVSQRTGSVTESEESSSITAKPSPTVESGGPQIRNVSFVLNVEVVLSKERLPHLSWTRTHFITIISGRKLKLKGDLADAEMAATFTFPDSPSPSTCQTQENGVCTKHLLLACVQLQGPAAMFPNTPMPKLAEVCYSHSHGSGEGTPGLRLMVPTLPGTNSRADTCQQGNHMSTYFSFDESLTVLLSLHDRSIINLRLMRTSYFLFVMVVTFFCYAMIRGRKTKTKSQHIPYVEKVDFVHFPFQIE